MDRGYSLRVMGSLLLVASFVIYYFFGKDNISDTLGLLMIIFLFGGLAILLIGIRYMKFQNDKKYEKFVQGNSKFMLWMFLAVVVIGLVIVIIPASPLTWVGLAVLVVILIIIAIRQWMMLIKSARYLRKTYSRKR